MNQDKDLVDLINYIDENYVLIKKENYVKMIEIIESMSSRLDKLCHLKD